MPLFSNKFSPKKTPTRKVGVFLANKDFSPKRIEKELGPNIGPIRLKLGDQETVFESGSWIPESGKIGGTYKENEKLKKELRRLEDENNLLKLKFELTQTTAECHSQKEELDELRQKLSHNKDRRS
ncbi:PREDICTED: protein chibby homolog 1 isoform X2 [Eufriesea mexicana]|uniref:protein chibby homolog 1 isoform X2 n=1 Tax=Eufriesea mexicana TaxID=516756 RepID=UPI00083BD518|nr:PREDICTED: protein chibby homolog 1 isoform X2 [Eufriesea mexicana]